MRRREEREKTAAAGTDVVWEWITSGTSFLLSRRLTPNLWQPEEALAGSTETDLDFIYFLVWTKHQLRERIQERSPRSCRHLSPCPPRRVGQDAVWDGRAWTLKSCWTCADGAFQTKEKNFLLHVLKAKTSVAVPAGGLFCWLHTFIVFD